MPLAATVNEAEPPAVTVTFVGWVVMVGADNAAFTVRVAVAEVAVPALLVATAV